ncbi:MAG: hypothetical protein LC746_06935, partial [Acidobacteria bacterium]|nr:hypothetical protein [Acidobacteriota bacterium]
MRRTPHTTPALLSDAFRLTLPCAVALAALVALSACADRSAPTGRAVETNANAPASNPSNPQTAQANSTNSNAAANPSPSAVPAPPQA